MIGLENTPPDGLPSPVRRHAVVGHFDRYPRIVILSTFASLSVDSAKDLGAHSPYSEILRLRLRMTRWQFQADPLPRRRFPCHWIGPRVSWKGTRLKIVGTETSRSP